MNELLDAALQYASRGWRVFPIHTVDEGGCCTCHRTCSSPGKHPRTKHGYKDATVSPPQIEAWWAKWPDANIGIATGMASGIAVLDVDGPAGMQRLVDLVRDSGTTLPATPCVVTARGIHIYFALGPGERAVMCTSGDGLDMRGDGGYVLAPPSRHPSGHIYRWRVGIVESGVSA
jgi:hypothetical protein